MDLVCRAQKNGGFDLADGRFTGVDEEFIRAGATHAVEDREQPQFRIANAWFAEPPVGEDGKFLRTAILAAVQREAARGFAVALAFAEQPEITRAKKRAEFIHPVRL